MECNHGKFTKIKASRSVAGLEFTTTAQRCTECEATLWSKENEAAFHDWLREQKKEHRDRFVIQKVQIPNELMQFASELANATYTSESDVYQAALSCYFYFVPTKDGWKELLDSEAYDTAGTKTQRKIQVNPGLFLTIESNAKLFGLANNAVATWAISRILKAAKAGHETRTLMEMSLRAAG